MWARRRGSDPGRRVQPSHPTNADAVIDHEADGTLRADVGKVPSTRRVRLVSPELLEGLAAVVEHGLMIRPGLAEGWVITATSGGFVAIDVG